jgi:hypothetical protein
MNNSFSSRNPFVKAGVPPQTRKAVTVFLDLLGFRERMAAAYASGEATSLLRTLRAALDEAGRHLIQTQHGSDPADLWKVKAFTDNVVLGMPIYDDAELDLGLVFSMVGLYQLTMVNHGFFVRGAIAVGELYIDEDIVFGAALIEAYAAEAQIARDPRVVLTSSAVALVKQHIGYYATLEHSPQYQELLIDSDGQVFLHYLGTAFNEDDNSPDVAALTSHRQNVELRLQCFSSRPIIWSKYAWLARYHNWICDEFGPQLVKLKIGTSFLHPTPKRLDWSTGNAPFDIC